MREAGFFECMYREGGDKIDDTVVIFVICSA